MPPQQFQRLLNRTKSMDKIGAHENTVIMEQENLRGFIDILSNAVNYSFFSLS